MLQAQSWDELDSQVVTYYNQGNYSEAAVYAEKALEQAKKEFGTKHENYGTSLNNLAGLYESMEQYDKALLLYLEALENAEKNLGKDHSWYAVYLNNLASLYEDMGQYDKALPLYLEALENINLQIDQAFSFMSEKEKEQFHKTVEKYFKKHQSFFTRYSSNNPSVAAHAYNIEIDIKGMILQSGIQTRQAIMNSGDSSALAKFEEWSLLRSILAKQYSLPIAERRSDLGEVEEKAEKLEASLSRLSSAFRNQEELTSSTWEGVQKALQPGEVAIEFASFQYRNDKEWTDSTLYIALVLRKGDKHPQLVQLFEEKQLNILLTQKEHVGDPGFVSNLYRGFGVFGKQTQPKGKGSDLYDLIWKPLESYLSDAQTVYFAPSGKLHQIAFAALPIGNDSLLSDRFRLEQVSTSSMLLRNQHQNTDKPLANAALYGGIYYDLTEENWLTEAQKLQSDATTWASRSLPEDIERGGTWTYLPGTLQEVDSISQLLEQHKLPFQIHTQEQALEEVFKQQTGNNSPGILHIATHGFFFPDPKTEKPDNLGTLGQEKHSVYKHSDNPLHRSGLLFAGANQAWKGKPVPDGLEDGILSAYEVSHLYLPNTRLVVMSACETGLGDIKGSEGVFGLQRAFKQAGAEFLLMSLWKVPDIETSEFMQFFYQRLITNNNIPESFKLAQNYMKQKYPNDPYKWAAFVLIK